jgi:hypothetical protein
MVFLMIKTSEAYGEDRNEILFQEDVFFFHYMKRYSFNIADTETAFQSKLSDSSLTIFRDLTM